MPVSYRYGGFQTVYHTRIRVPDPAGIPPLLGATIAPQLFSIPSSKAVGK
jgi:hypothetical protein